MPKKVTTETDTLVTVSEETAEAVLDPEVENENTDPLPDSEAPAESEEPPKTKRTRKKKTDTESAELPENDAPPAEETEEIKPEPEPQPAQSVPARRSAKTKEDPILTLEVGADVETEESVSDIAWHEIHNAYRTRRILTGYLGGIEQTDAGKTIAIVEYKGFRVVIPLKEMTVKFPNQLSGDDYTQMVTRQNKLISKMLGAEIDFVVKGIDSKTRSIVASRKEAMLKKRQLFYMETDNSGAYRIYDGRIIQARVIAVAEKAIRIEAFGVETSIMARDLAWDWIGDAHDRFSVGDQVLVRVLEVKRDSVEDISIRADAKSVSDNTSRDNLKKCRIQSKYAGKVTDIHKGVVYIRLTNGVNAIAHSCYDRRMPGKKDDVSFAVTHIDEERGVAVGIITRIIKQNL
ncbi:MAG: S1 RNA-binding domain-containing protein [Muribaculaceae bacterium]|nr:S1 RNA-binding domain-containing protein [Muribaculaceae bacterium]